MKHKINLDDYAVLIYIGHHGPLSKREYWITYSGHAHSQAGTGLPAGTLGKHDQNGDYLQLSI